MDVETSFQFHQSIAGFPHNIQQILEYLFEGHYFGEDLGLFWKDIYEEWSNSGYGYYIKNRNDFDVITFYIKQEDMDNLEEDYILELVRRKKDLSYYEASTVLTIDNALIQLADGDV